MVLARRWVGVSKKIITARFIGPALDDGGGLDRLPAYKHRYRRKICRHRLKKNTVETLEKDVGIKVIMAKT